MVLQILDSGNDWFANIIIHQFVKLKILVKGKLVLALFFYVEL